MEQILLILSVAIMFLIRIGVPVIVLIILGILIDRWQAKRDKDVQKELRRHA